MMTYLSPNVPSLSKVDCYDIAHEINCPTARLSTMYDGTNLTRYKTYCTIWLIHTVSTCLQSMWLICDTYLYPGDIEKCSVYIIL